MWPLCRMGIVLLLRAGEMRRLGKRRCQKGRDSPSLEATFRKTRQSNEAAASGVRKRDVLTGARSQGRSAVERVTEAVAGAGIMFRPFKSLGVVDFPGMRHHPIPCHAASSRCRSPPGRPLGYGGGGRTHGAARLGRRGRDHLAGMPLSKRRADCRWGGEPSVVGAACRSLSE